MKSFAPPKAPNGLSAEARAWWKKITTAYQVEDDAGCLLLATALEAFDRMRQAQKAIQSDGAVFRDRFGQLKQHPAITTERDSRTGMLAALKALNLDLEPLHDRPGRPSGSR